MFIKGNKPHDKEGTNMATNGKGDDAIYVDADSIQYVKRGRKANLDQGLVDKLKGLPAGKALVISSLKQDPSATTYANDKARVGSSIRTACKAAGLTGYRILWSPQGVPQVVR